MAATGTIICEYQAAPAMFTSTEDFVLSLADEDDNLSGKDAAKLLAEHGFTMDDVYAEPGDISHFSLDARNCHALLAWLGYWHLAG